MYIYIYTHVGNILMVPYYTFLYQHVGFYIADFWLSPGILEG